MTLPGRRLPPLASVLIGFVLPVLLSGSPVTPLAWDQLPSIPDEVGFAGSFTGVHNNVLFVGGGANFPTRPPWEGGERIWHDRMFALDATLSAWREAGRLPRPSGNGLSLTTPNGVVLVGGGAAAENLADVFLARWNGQAVEFATLPSLPLPLAMPAGALLGRTVFVAGGLDRPNATQAQPVFLSLNLDRLEDGWTTLATWPGPERFLATGGALDGSFFLFGGARLIPGADDKPQREWLRDAYRYTPGRGWQRLADLPVPLVATPGPAPALGPAHLLLLGGDDGSRLHFPPQDHPGFPRTLYAYHTLTDSWAERGALPFSLVTTGTAAWNGRIIVPGVEARPGVRSTEVWAGTPHRPKPAFGWLRSTTITLPWRVAS